MQLLPQHSILQNFRKCPRCPIFLPLTVALRDQPTCSYTGIEPRSIPHGGKLLNHLTADLAHAVKNIEMKNTQA